MSILVKSINDAQDIYGRENRLNSETFKDFSTSKNKCEKEGKYQIVRMGEEKIEHTFNSFSYNLKDPRFTESVIEKAIGIFGALDESAAKASKGKPFRIYFENENIYLI